jgi:hypothetical protein
MHALTHGVAHPTLVGMAQRGVRWLKLAPVAFACMLAGCHNSDSGWQSPGDQPGCYTTDINASELGTAFAGQHRAALRWSDEDSDAGAEPGAPATDELHPYRHAQCRRARNVFSQALRHDRIDRYRRAHLQRQTRSVGRVADTIAARIFAERFARGAGRQSIQRHVFIQRSRRRDAMTVSAWKPLAVLRKKCLRLS